MNIIPISKHMFNNLEKIDTIDINTEGEIYEFDYHNIKRVFKKLYVNDGVNFAKKMYILEVLSSNRDVFSDEFVLPDNLVSVDNKIVGFSYPFVDGVTLKTFLNSDSFSLSSKIDYLKQVGIILEKMDSIRKFSDLRNFYLNDIHESNFMIDFNNSKLNVIDLDGCKMCSSFSFPSRFLNSRGLFNNVNKYNVESDLRHGAYVMANRDSDLYCYIIMILNFLYGCDINNIDINSYYEYLRYLSYIGIDDRLLNSFSKIISYGDNINPYEFLDSLTEEQVCRAKGNVYKIVKSKL